MFLLRAIATAACCAAAITPVFSADPAGEPKTLLTERGELLYSADLSQPLDKEWHTAKGTWEVVDGAIRGAEIKAEMHGAVTRHTLTGSDFVIQYMFKLEGAKQSTLSINDAKGHCCRVLINPTGFSVQKDSHDHNKADKAVSLGKNQTPIKPGEWHTLVVELRGTEILAGVDGTAYAHGQHDALAVPKKDFGLTVAGASVSFKNVRVWQGKPNKDWDASKLNR